MKITFLVTGSGGSFYCSNCYRDMLFLRSVKMTGGIEATAIPLYLPPEKEYIESGFDTNVFFGAISLYIREKIHFLEQMPAFMDKILDSPPLLKMAAKRAGTTRSEGMEELTLNMIDGTHSARDREVQRLVSYMVNRGKPDVIHLSNALIIGLARQIKRITDIKIVCSLQNEDDWVNDMAEPYQSKAWNMMGSEAEYIDAFIAPSNYYKEFYVKHTGTDPGKIFVIPSGLDVNTVEHARRNDSGPAIGYFSRINYHNGFDKLTDAFLLLKEKPEFSNLSLFVSGGFTGDDKHFIREQINKIKAKGFAGDFKIFPDFQGKGKQEFFNSIDLLSVPVRKYDAYGLYILESNAAGIPVVQPSTGSFSEILSLTGGGLTYEPDSVDALAMKIAELLKNEVLRKELGMKGSKAVRETLSLKNMSEKLVSVYSTLK